jgi:hypothetical protein
MKTCVSVFASCAFVACIAGCANLSPEMKGLGMTPDENQKMVRVTNNQNARMIADDLARSFYLDHPSRLSSYPVTSTSGMPR